MKALSLFQPFATLVVAGMKRLDSRCWYTGYRGRVAIYALDRDPEAWGLDLCEMRSVREALHWRGCGNLGEMPRGAMMGTVELVDCVRCEDLTPMLLTRREQLFATYKPGRWVFVFRGAVRFPAPVAAMGRTGLWEWRGATA